MVMGCSVSTTAAETDPNLLYGHRKYAYDAQPVQNGHFHNGHLKNDGPSQVAVTFTAENEKAVDETTSEKSEKSYKVSKDEKNKTLKGDLIKREDARISRHKTLQERSKKRDQLAWVISERAMDEKEMLSLVSSRSRRTSISNSPTNHHRDIVEASFSGIQSAATDSTHDATLKNTTLGKLSSLHDQNTTAGSTQNGAQTGDETKGQDGLTQDTEHQSNQHSEKEDVQNSSSELDDKGNIENSNNEPSEKEDVEHLNTHLGMKEDANNPSNQPSEKEDVENPIS